ncbi:hypothetical protein KKA02_04600 [Patescibacteria group bacterium]|nr:hypothetical protein [Patescibacteria group bacterium]
MKFLRSNRFKRQYRKLDSGIQNKVKKILVFMADDLKDSSLKIKKMRGIEAWEVRIDYRYRMSFGIMGDVVVLYAVGMHDEGLGKK